MLKKIAIVTPWFGEDQKGGAEQQAFQLATRFSGRGLKVDVLTTCGHSFLSNWSEDFYPSGQQELPNGLVVQRFPLDSRNEKLFDDVNAQLLDTKKLRAGVSPVGPSGEKVWLEDNINSTALLDYLSTSIDKYDAFIFLPYLYGLTLNGVKIVAEKAWLQPCLHDESYAYLESVADVVFQCRGLLFLSEGEQHIAASIYGPVAYSKGYVCGAGIEPYAGSKRYERHFESLPANFALCLGRRAAEKGTKSLVDEFTRFQGSISGSLTLVLAGPGDSSFADESNGVIDLGLVSEQEKDYLLANCLVLCQPSPNESFSRVIYEAWQRGKPVMVNGECLAMRLPVEDSQGGWVIEDKLTWAEGFSLLDTLDPVILKNVGNLGRVYGEPTSEWERVIDRYLDVLFKDKVVPSKDLVGVTINQLLPNMAFGDAISNQALHIQNWLLQRGALSQILVDMDEVDLDKRVAPFCTILDSELLPDCNALIYHHSIGHEVTTRALRHEGQKCLLYHNITPPEFYLPYRPDFARLLRNGREEMWALSKEFKISAADSDFNGVELENYGFSKATILGLPIDPAKWSNTPDSNLMAELQDGKLNVLFVGRYAPNKCQHQMLDVLLELLAIRTDVRLILAGSGHESDPYVESLIRKITELGLSSWVKLTGHVSDSELQSIYSASDCFFSMSEHEGFGVPLIEAMWFDLPVVAYKSSAIGETLGDAGVLYTDKRDVRALAALINGVTSKESLRRKVLGSQRRRRDDFLPEAMDPLIFSLLSKMGILSE